LWKSLNELIIIHQAVLLSGYFGGLIHDEANIQEYLVIDVNGETNNRLEG